MKTINKPADNLGGLIKIWAIPNTVFWISGKTVNISDYKNVYQIYCSPDSMAFKEVHKNDDSGNHYQCSLSGFIPKDTEANNEAISFIEPRKWIIVFMDGNGNCKAAGNSFEPLNASFTMDTKSQTSERAGFDMQFSGITTSRAPFVDNPF